MEKKYPDRNHGKQTKQRLKPYIVLQYLLRNTDEKHFATGKDIEGYYNTKPQPYFADAISAAVDYLF